MAYYGYQLHPAWRASIGAGTAFSAPTFNQLYYPGYGDPTLRPERARNREASLVHEQGATRATLTWYDNRVSDLIQAVLVQPPWGYGARNMQQARLTDWSLSGATRLADWRVQAALDWLDARDRHTDYRLPRRARETLSLAATRDFGAWTLRGGLRAVGARFDDAAEKRRMGGFAVFDVGVDYRIDGQTTVFARLNNAFDKRYELAADYGAPRASLFVGLRLQSD